jgi:methylated-DNA-protein-cysteine methyltransferase-like protein
MAANDAYERIWHTVRAIPRGRVATYGQIADLAGMPRRARLVGRALKELEDDRVPWHRVLRAGGRIAFTRGTRQHREQRARLLREGVVFDGDRIDLGRYGWSDALDRILWGPPQEGGAEESAAKRSRRRR